MKRSLATKMGVFACSLTLACGSLAACANGMSSATDDQIANRTYMSQVNQTMDELDEGLDSFVDAVSRGDVVNMHTQADNAYRTLDKLDSLEAPEDLEDIKQNYVDGTAKLREALDGYISLYSDINAAGEAFDWSTYDARIADIQADYDEGIAALQDGDQAAADKS